MKRILSMLITTLILSSCSSNEEIIDNSIVGKWNLNFMHDETGELPIPACRTLTLYSFNKDKSFQAEIYNMGTSVTDCLLDETISGTWKALGNSTFELSNKKHLTLKTNNSIQLRENKNSTRYQVLLPK